VWLLHKALEASQLEKRTCAEFLAVEGEQERLEVLRHRARQAADLRSRLDDLKTQMEGLSCSLAERDSQVMAAFICISHRASGNRTLALTQCLPTRSGQVSFLFTGSLI